MNRIAILGWGSLIWEARPEFERSVLSWNTRGPLLSIEFSRISESRGSALTLVLDPERGTSIETLYAISKRTDPRDAVCDLRSREGTTMKNIGFIDLAGKTEHGRDENSRQVIKTWAKEHEINFVAWTDLSPHFDGVSRDALPSAALTHLKSLDSEQLRQAVTYIVSAPQQTKTRLREALMDDEWFQTQIKLFK